jgi:hypothetical protein
MSKFLKWAGTIDINISFIDYVVWKESLQYIYNINWLSIPPISTKRKTTSHFKSSLLN